MNPLIKSITEISYNAIFKFGLLTKETKAWDGDCVDFDRYLEFDKNGNIIKEVAYDSEHRKHQQPSTNYKFKYGINGKESESHNISLVDFKEKIHVRVYIYKYDVNDNLKERKTYFIDQGNSGSEYYNLLNKEGWIDSEKYQALNDFLESQETFKYDGIGNIIENSMFDESSGLIFRNTYNFDYYGNMFKCIYYDPENEISEKTESLFNKNKQLIEKKVYCNNVICESERIIRDVQGRILEIHQNNDKGELVCTETRDYNESITNQTINDLNSAGEVIHKMVLKSDEDKNLMEKLLYNQDGKLYSKSSNLYNKNKELVESKYLEFNDDFTYTTKKYEFDEYNNWIKCIVFDKEIPIKILEREIVYFD